MGSTREEKLRVSKNYSLGLNLVKGQRSESSWKSWKDPKIVKGRDWNYEQDRKKWCWNVRRADWEDWEEEYKNRRKSVRFGRVSEKKAWRTYLTRF